MIPRQNGFIVAQGLARLTGAYVTQPNCRALLAAYLQPLQDIENALFAILQARVLDTATCYPNSDDPTGPTQNVVFDDIGALIGLDRGGPAPPVGNGLADYDYRALIYLEIAVNRSTGRISDWTRFATILTPFCDAIYYLDGDNADFTFGLWDLTISAILVGAALSRAVPNGVGGVLAYSTWPDDGDDLILGWTGDASVGQQGLGWSGDASLGGVLVAGIEL